MSFRSFRIFRIFRDYTPLVQGLSLDEAFLDLSGSITGPAAAHDIATQLKLRIRRELALTASIGVGPNKLVAKIASDLDKPDGLRIVTAEQLHAVYEQAYAGAAFVQVVTGTSPHGQGHETSWSMIVAEKLGIDPADVDVLHSDTAIAPLGMDTYGSRSLPVGGVAVGMACDKVIDKAKQIAAHQMEASVDDLEFVGGEFRVAGSPDRSMPLAAIAFAAFTAHDLPDGLEPNLEAQITYDPPNFSWPFEKIRVSL